MAGNSLINIPCGNCISVCDVKAVMICSNCRHSLHFQTRNQRVVSVFCMIAWKRRSETVFVYPAHWLYCFALYLFSGQCQNTVGSKAKKRQRTLETQLVAWVTSRWGASRGARSIGVVCFAPALTETPVCCPSQLCGCNRCKICNHQPFLCPLHTPPEPSFDGRLLMRNKPDDLDPVRPCR